MKVYVFGNEDDVVDKRAFTIQKKLRKEYSDVHFEQVKPNQDLPFADEKNVYILDVVVGLKKPTLLDEKNIDNFTASPRSSVHDYDIGVQLKYLKKLGKIGRVFILGIPAEGTIDYDSIQSIFKKLVAQDIQGS